MLLQRVREKRECLMRRGLVLANVQMERTAAVTVNAVAPGWIRTDMNAAVRESAQMVKAIEADIALGRFGEISDVAAVVAFLASDAARWVTAQVIEASGGYKL